MNKHNFQFDYPISNYILFDLFRQIRFKNPFFRDWEFFKAFLFLAY